MSVIETRCVNELYSASKQDRIHNLQFLCRRDQAVSDVYVLVSSYGINELEQLLNSDTTFSIDPGMSYLTLTATGRSHYAKQSQ